MNPTHYVTTLAGVRMPRLLYGTAWKKEATADLVLKAIKNGYRGIDTACQPKHYNETGVGEAVQRAINDGLVVREDLFIQTKFTSVDGHDPNRIPYDPRAPLEQQVHQSLEKSLQHFGTNYIDSLVLHSPMRTFEDTLTVWKTMEGFVTNGQVKQLGISNCYDPAYFKKLWDAAEVKPAVIQNRFFQDTGYDISLRHLAKVSNVYYQSFWTLSANPQITQSEKVLQMAKKYGKTPEQCFFSYLIHHLNIIVLTGTKNEEHMKHDLDVLDFTITAEEKAIFDKFIH